MHLPSEVLQHILRQLDPPSAISAGSTSKGASRDLPAWHAALQAPNVWRDMLVEWGYMKPGESAAAAAAAQAGETSYSPAADRVAGISTYELLFCECWKRDARWGRHISYGDKDVRAQLRPRLRYYRPSGSHEHVWRIKTE